MQIIKSPYNMVKKCSLLLLGLFAMIQISIAQVTVTISDDAADPGQTVDMDVSYTNFEGIISFQYSIEWDSTKFEFNSIQNVTDELDQFTESSISTPVQTDDKGVLQISWSKTNTQPETLPNGTRIFTLRLTAIGDACTTDAVRLSNNPIPIEFADEDFNNLGGVPDNGTATINGSNCGDGELTITVDDVTVDAGDNRCVPVRVENFVDIQAVEFLFKFDPTIARYTGYQNAALTDFDDANLNDLEADMGRLKLVWFDFSASNPVTLDGTLIEFCFDAIGVNAEVSDLEVGGEDEDAIDFTNSDEVSVSYTSNDGSFEIAGDIPPDAFTLIAGDVTIAMGDVACVPISVRNFTNIQTMQFLNKWDPDALMFSEVRALNLSQLTQENISTEDDDKLKVSWSNPQSVTVPDGTVIFELCLEARGDCDNTTSVDFVSEPFFAIEVSNSDNEVVDVARVSGDVTIDCDGCAIAIQSLESPSCPGEADGSIRVNLASGVTFTCTWTDSDGTVIQQSNDCDLVNVEAGEYTLAIDDGADCQNSRTFTLESPGNIIFGGSKVNEDESCDGSINLDMMGGTEPFTFSWDDGSTSEIRTMLCAGEYCVTATDANGCVAETCFTIQAGGPTTCGIDITNVRCNGDDDGEIDICVEGGTGPYTVEWSGPSGEFGTEDISGLLAGTYNYTLTDSSDPVITSQGSVVVEEPDAITVSSMVTASDGDNGAIDLSVAGGTAPYTFLWSPGDFMTEDISGLASGTYTVVVTDENNCMSSFDVDVESTTIMPMLDIADASCNNVCDGSIDGVVSGGTAPYTYELDDAQVTFPLNDLCPGEYMFKVTDADGLQVTQTIIIENPDPLTVVTENVVNCTDGMANGSIRVEVEGGTPEYSFNWSTTGDGDQITGLGSMRYNVVVTDARGCTATLDQDVEIDCGGGVCFTARTLISPNGDNVNDEFQIMCAPNVTNSLLIFDRWGRTVFTQEAYDNTWMGTNQSGEELPDGGYLWVLEVTNGDGSKELHRGSVTIIRDQF